MTTKILFVLAKKIDGDRRSFEELSCALGFSTKVKTSENLVDLEFLKGIWLYDSRQNAIWVPLPSQILKLGKSIRDPRIIFKTRYGKPSWDQAYKIFSKNVVASLKCIPFNYPVLGDFLSILNTFQPEHFVAAKPEDVIEDYTYKTHIRADERVVLSQAHITLAREAFCRRYEVTIDEIDNAISVIRTVTTLPVVMHHRLFFRMRTVDYGGDAGEVFIAPSDGPGEGVRQA